MITARNTWKKDGNWQMPLKRHDSKLHVLIVNTMRQIPAAELERRWNEKLIKVRELEERIAEHETTPNVTLCRTDRDRLLSLGQDLPTAWYSVGASVETRKKIIRLLIEEIIVDVVDDKIELVIPWQGGDHTRLSVKKNKSGHNRLTTDADVVEFVRVLARHMPDNTIASILKSGSFCSCGQPENSHTAGILPIGDEFCERIIFRGIEEIIGKRPP
jgi:hypothetical protein